MRPALPVLTAALAAPRHAACSAADVLTLDSINFAASIGSGPALVQFYAPWCAHCKKLAPEWNAAAGELKGSAVLARCDATEEPELAARYDVQAYPTIKIFMHGTDVGEYEGGRTAGEIAGYVRERLLRPAARLVADAKALQKEQQASRALACLFAAEGSEQAVAWEAFTSRHRLEHAFGVTHSAELAQQEGVTPPAVVMYKQFGDTAVYPGTPESWDSGLLPWIKSHSFKVLEEITPQNYRDHVDRGIPLAWLFVDPSRGEQTQGVVGAVSEVAAEFHGKLGFVWLSGLQYAQMADRVGLVSRKWPAIGIDNGEGEHFAFEEGREITADALRPWVQSFLNGTLAPTVKSQDAPEHPTSKGLTTLVGSTIRSVAFDPAKDVLVQFHAPWCGHCKSLAPAYAELAKRFEGHATVVVARMDATLNDAPKEFDVSGFPAIYLVRGETNELVRYEGERRAEDMAMFIVEHARWAVEPAGDE
eukprot:TRINITY_DN66533_c0_g1_i1.p1 TRINITY_DN66533_c0_g1~~TRINITY_DN66533_c0_g1_i1.p1  ORF type:complete len:503 (+),score=123.12 TRINITY_DN66533_c0_g1_i1:80-1510(+)